MPKPQRPRDPLEGWDGGFFFEPPRPVRSVSARGGLVVAGGEDLYLLRPGEENILSRKPPLDIGPVHGAAAEPRGDRRTAFLAEEMVAFFFRKGTEDQILRLRPPPPAPRATHLAWGGTTGPSALYVRWEDGGVTRMKPDLSNIEVIEVPPIDALAVDDTGVVAMVSLSPDPMVLLVRDEEMATRLLPEGDYDEEALHIAVGGVAVAVCLPDGAVLLSRGEGDPFEPCLPLTGASALVFEGEGPEAALIGAVSGPDTSVITRVDWMGRATCIADLSEASGGPVEITSLSWDASRARLWGASPEGGLFIAAAPPVKGGRKVLS